MSTTRQRLEATGARLLLGLPTAALRLVAGRPIERDGQKLDPQAQMVLRLLAWRGASLGGRDVATERRLMKAQSGTLGPRTTASFHVDELSLAGPAGALAARRYRIAGSEEETAQPAIVFFHGGGFVVGDLDTHDAVCRALAHHAGCTVIAVDYRLAPEAPAPAAAHDAIAAFRDIATRSAMLGIDSNRLAVAGDSAGGNLAAIVAQQTRDDACTPRIQALFYPVVDFAIDHPSKSPFDAGFVLEKKSMDWFEAHYLNAEQDKRDPLISPIYGAMNGVAPAYVQTAGFDPLRDEGEAYAALLQAAGVPTTLVRESGLYHGYLNMAGGIDRADAALRHGAQHLRRCLHD
ncbi:alpha/beta hydrolase [Salinisphaera sp. Q1T1-3]|uniref:alpha/beta hydrolase n=1 Tax=Salinisphaera sp. Q1T1-3 TaxID=2321229 RepID=UPI000E76E5FA|nr:alpha/beta hydrolase [Salinisphaera sp. Q1T1-3]RJS95069.1 alpha/beta hydrolase [Salinisphaera sp. Q1T1-3]